MSNLNKTASLIFILFSTLGVSAISFADVVMESQGSALTLIKANGKLYGYYAQDVQNFSCRFLIYGDDTSSKDIRILTYYARNTFGARETESDIPGQAREINSDNWLITTKENQGGCGGATGSFLANENSNRATVFKIAKKYFGMSIRVIIRKSPFHAHVGGAFPVRKGYVVEGDVVVVLKQDSTFSLVQYTNPSNGNSTSGWIETESLANPFPDAKNR